MRVNVKTCFAQGKKNSELVQCAQPFVTCIIDPDWPYTLAPGAKKRDVKKGKLSGYTRNKDGKNQYKQDKPLSIEELKQLPINEFVGGYLLMWCVGPFLINGAARDLMTAWGFQPCSILTWAKWNRERNSGYGGVGFWFLGNAEFVMVGKRPGWPSIRTGMSSLIVEPKQEHSAKPDNVHKLCEARFPGPYLEIFGRRKRKGWTVLGNEAPGDGEDIRDSLDNLPGRGF